MHRAWSPYSHLLFWSDPIPRLSVANCGQLATEIAADDPLYKERFAQDRSAYMTYVKTLGKTQAMSHAEDDGEVTTDAMGTGDGTIVQVENRGCKQGDDVSEDDAGSTRAGGPALVVPGRVILLEGRDGAMRACEGDSRLPTLRRIPVTQRAISDHSISSYALALREVRQTRGRHLTPSTPPTPFALAKIQGGNGWAPCFVCGSDVTWTAPVSGSDTARAWATHHCRNCGGIVCAFCAPAGDKVAGDSIGEFVTLSDHRIPLPSRCHLEPARVCRPCSYISYDL